MTDEEKRKIQLERTSLAAEYGNDFDSIQKYCIEKIIKRNLNIKSTIIGKLYNIYDHSISYRHRSKHIFTRKGSV